MRRGFLRGFSRSRLDPLVVNVWNLASPAETLRTTRHDTEPRPDSRCQILGRRPANSNSRNDDAQFTSAETVDRRCSVLHLWSGWNRSRASSRAEPACGCCRRNCGASRRLRQSPTDSDGFGCGPARDRCHICEWGAAERGRFVSRRRTVAWTLHASRPRHRIRPVVRNDLVITAEKPIVDVGVIALNAGRDEARG